MLIHPRPHALTPRIPLARRGGWGLWQGGAHSLVWAPGFLDPQTGSHEGGAPGTLRTGVNRRCLRPWVCAWVPAADRGRVAMPPVHAAQRVPRLHVRPHPAAFFSCAPHSPTARRILNGSSVYHTDSPGAHDLVPGPPQWTWHRLPLPAQRQTHGPRRPLSHRAAEAWDMSLLLVTSWLLFSLLRYLLKDHHFQEDFSPLPSVGPAHTRPVGSILDCLCFLCNVPLNSFICISSTCMFCFLYYSLSR